MLTQGMVFNVATVFVSLEHAWVWISRCCTILMVLQHRMLQAQASCSMETLDTLLRIPNVTQHPNSDWAMCFAPEKMVSLNTPQCGGDQFIIGLIVVDRLHGDDVENRPVVIYNSMDDHCAMRFRKSFYKFMLAPGYHHKARTTGTAPTDWVIRWDSHYGSDSAVVEFLFMVQMQLRFVLAKQTEGM